MKLPTLLKRLESLKNNIELLNKQLGENGFTSLDTKCVEVLMKDVKRAIPIKQKELS